MDNIKVSVFSVFDFFAYLLPGSVILLSFTIVYNPSLSKISDLGRLFQGVDISNGLTALAISYVIGFASDSIASWLYYIIVCRVLGSPKPALADKLNVSEQRALVREFSTENFQSINSWKVLKTMAHNLAFASLILMFSVVIEAFQSVDQKAQWFSIAFLTLAMSVIFMHRAHVFDTWHYKDLSTVVKALHLEKRALTDANLSSPTTTLP
jgi:chromate transport protein ChrA